MRQDVQTRLTLYARLNWNCSTGASSAARRRSRQSLCPIHYRDRHANATLPLRLAHIETSFQEFNRLVNRPGLGSDAARVTADKAGAERQLCLHLLGKFFGFPFGSHGRRHFRDDSRAVNAALARQVERIRTGGQFKLWSFGFYRVRSRSNQTRGGKRSLCRCRRPVGQ